MSNWDCLHFTVIPQSSPDKFGWWNRLNRIASITQTSLLIRYMPNKQKSSISIFWRMQTHPNQNVWVLNLISPTHTNESKLTIEKGQSNYYWYRTEIVNFGEAWFCIWSSLNPLSPSQVWSSNNMCLPNGELPCMVWLSLITWYIW